MPGCSSAHLPATAADAHHHAQAPAPGGAAYVVVSSGKLLQDGGLFVSALTRNIG
jgi:hypothetical protein